MKWLLCFKIFWQELQTMNSKLDSIQGYGSFISLEDIGEKLDEIKGDGLYNSISDLYDLIDPNMSNYKYKTGQIWSV